MDLMIRDVFFAYLRDALCCFESVSCDHQGVAEDHS